MHKIKTLSSIELRPFVSQSSTPTNTPHRCCQSYCIFLFILISMSRIFSCRTISNMLPGQLAPSENKTRLQRLSAYQLMKKPFLCLSTLPHRNLYFLVHQLFCFSSRLSHPSCFNAQLNSFIFQPFTLSNDSALFHTEHQNEKLFPVFPIYLQRGYKRLCYHIMTIKYILKIYFQEVDYDPEVSNPSLISKPFSA